MTSHATVKLTSAASAALDRGRKLAVATDADDETLAATRAVARQLAAEHGLDVVLYDRSEETWMDTPHPSGPCDPGQLDERGRGHLVEQIAEFEQAGVDAVAWIATVPSITEIVDVVRELDVDTILLPTSGEQKMLDRLKGERPSKVVERITEFTLDHPVTVLVHDGDDVRVEEPPTP